MTSSDAISFDNHSAQFDNSYARLAPHFYSRTEPTPVKKPELIRANKALALQLGIDPTWLDSDAAIQAFAGNTILPGSEPIATVYAGHQFGSWNPQLGDGRAILLGEIVTKHAQRFDIQLKGSGETPYSRMGDGRSPLGPVLREYIVSEAMAALGVPTTRSLAAISSGEKVAREQLLPGAVLTRVASSHIRVGTFQYFSARGDIDAVRALADHVIARHFPELIETENKYLELLNAVIDKQAHLIANWQQLGFIHGVMNTDNMLVCGETIDYGPCAFMDGFNPNQVYSSIDRQGRYAFRNQPPIAHWNLSWLAQSLLPLFGGNDEKENVAIAQAALDRFAENFQSNYSNSMLRKIGLTRATTENIALLEDLLTRMAQSRVDYTLLFRRLSELADENSATFESVSKIFSLPELFDEWVAHWQQALLQEGRDLQLVQAAMFAANPVFIARNHLVEEAIQAANNHDFEPFHRLVDVLSDPHEFAEKNQRYAMAPRDDQIVAKTFCGT